MLGFKKKKSDLDLVDLEYMKEVDAALRYTGRRWVYWALALLLGGFVLFLVWAALTERDEVTKGHGQIIPSMGIQPVQSPETGTLASVYVRENEYVAKDQLLASISDVQAQAGYNELMNQKVEYEFTIRRLVAEQSGVPLEFSYEEYSAHPESVSDQMLLYNARREKNEQEREELNSQLSGRKLELQEADVRRRQYEQSLLLLKQQERKVEPLVRSKTYSEIDYLNLLQRIVSQEGELSGLAQSISRLHSVVEEMQARLDSLEPERQAAIATELQEARVQLAAVNERLTSGKANVDSRELRAPMAG